jgi:putative ABC transport system permease protein
MIVAGIALGVGLSVFLTRLVRGLLFGINTTDPVALAVAVAVVMFASLAAACMPAYRATLVDPSIALRGDSE